MKKIIVIIFILICSSFLYAAPVGNPFSPEVIEEGFFISPASWINFRLGYEGNFVSDARMEKQDTSDEKVDNFKIDINGGSFTLNLQNRIDLYGVLGASRIRSDWRYTNANVVSRIEIETNYRFAYSVGGRAILYQWGNTALDVGDRYSYTIPSVSFITRDGAPQDKGVSQVRYNDWQINMGLAHVIDIFIPYIGMKYLRAKAKIRNFDFVISNDGQGLLSMKNRDRFGGYVGCTLSNKKNFMLTLEARFVDEEAITVSGELKF